MGLTFRHIKPLLTLLIAIAIGVASDAQPPVQDIRLSVDTLSKDKIVTYTPRESFQSFEINATFGSNSALKLLLKDTLTLETTELTAHLSDRKVSSENSYPIFLIEIRQPGKKTASFQYERKASTGRFIALKMSGDTLHVGAPRFDNFYILQGLGRVDIVTAAATGKVPVERTIIKYPHPRRPI